MKFLPFLVTAVSLSLLSCDKAKDLLSKKPPKATTAPAKLEVRKAPVDLRMLGSTDEHDEFIKGRGALRVVQFHSEKCQFSKMMCASLDEVAAEYPGRVILGRVDVAQAVELTRREGVNAYPRTMIHRDGKRVEVIGGLVPADKIREIFERHSRGIPVPPPEQLAQTPAAPPIQPMTKDWLPPGIERR